jgi:two-component system KDP operon response regulator KdpE
MMAGNILIIDDEPQIRKLLEITLSSNEFITIAEVSGKTGMAAAKTYSPDLILLDLGLPDLSGHDVIASLRKWYTRPILVLSVQSAEEEIVQALNEGANDYLVKPFRSGELIARIKTALRGFPKEGGRIHKNERIEIDLDRRELRKDGEPVKLTSIEFKLIQQFAENEGRVLTHMQLLRDVWGPGYIEQTQYLRVFIAQLRKKIETDPNNPKVILTESGVGYRFVLNDN